MVPGNAAPAAALPENFLEMQSLKIYRIRYSGMEPRTRCFNKLYWWFWRIWNLRHKLFFPSLDFSRLRDPLNLLLIPALPLSSSMTSTKSFDFPKLGGDHVELSSLQSQGSFSCQSLAPNELSFCFPPTGPQCAFFLPLLWRTANHLLCPLACISPQVWRPLNNENNNALCGSDIELIVPESTWSACSWPTMGSNMLSQCRYAPWISAPLELG